MKAKKYRNFIIAGMLVFSGIFVGMKTIAQEPDDAQMRQEFRRRLTGSGGVAVYVDVIARDESEKKTMTEEVREDTERVLKDSGIKILPEADLEYTRGRPRLRVHLVTYKESSQRDVYIYSFRIFHMEDATLDRNDGYAEALCWDSGMYVGRERLSSIRSTMKGHLGRYINDYLAANPKRPEIAP